MPSQIYTILGLLLLIGLIFMWAALRAWSSRRIVSGSIHTMFATSVIALFAAGFMLLTNIYTYQQFTQERVVASLRFEAMAPNSYRAHLHNSADNIGAQYILYGHIWQLDVRVLKWKNAGTLLGLKPLYRLERLSSRFEDDTISSNRRARSYNLGIRAGLELWEVAKLIKHWLPLLDVMHGNASYMPMADGAHYEVSITTGGLVARPLNIAAKNAVKNWN